MASRDACSRQAVGKDVSIAGSTVRCAPKRAAAGIFQVPAVLAPRNTPEDRPMTNIDQLPYVEAELNYLAPMSERPRYYAFEPQAGEPRSNLTPEPHQMQTLRPIACELGLDVQGFALLEQRSAVQDFWDDDEVRRVYYPEAERFLKDVTGASRIFIFDHLQRRRVDGAKDRSRSG